MTNPNHRFDGDDEAPPTAPLPLPPHPPGPEYGYTPHPSAAYQEYSAVSRPVDRHENLAVTALVLGIIGAAAALIPFGFVVAIILGILAIIFGAIGRRPTKGKWGLALGIATVAISIIWIIVLAVAVDNTVTSTSVAGTSDAAMIQH